jgi:hypothetical protein
MDWSRIMLPKKTKTSESLIKLNRKATIIVNKYNNKYNNNLKLLRQKTVGANSLHYLQER